MWGCWAPGRSPVRPARRWWRAAAGQDAVAVSGDLGRQPTDLPPGVAADKQARRGGAEDVAGLGLALVDVALLDHGHTDAAGRDGVAGLREGLGVVAALGLQQLGHDDVCLTGTVEQVLQRILTRGGVVVEQPDPFRLGVGEGQVDGLPEGGVGVRLDDLVDDPLVTGAVHEGAGVVCGAGVDHHEAARPRGEHGQRQELAGQPFGCVVGHHDGDHFGRIDVWDVRYRVVRIDPRPEIVLDDPVLRCLGHEELSRQRA